MLSLRPLRTCRLQDVLKYTGEEAPARHLSTFSTGTAQTLGERKERPVPGSHRKARLSQHESATPTAPLLSPRSQPTSSSGATPNPAGEGGGGTAATRPFHPTQTAAASSARFPNTGGSRCVVQLRPERAEGARRHHCSRRPPAGAKPDGRRSRCVRGITGPPALPPRPRLNSHKAHRDEAAGKGLRGVGAQKWLLPV